MERVIDVVFFVIYACLLSDPSSCKAERFQLFEENVTQLSCMRNGMMEAAKWSSTNPKWRVVKYRCEPRTEKDKT
jgi:hypothetical protein